VEARCPPRLDQGILRLNQYPLERHLIEVFKGCDHRQPTDELGNQSVLQQILRFHLTKNLTGLAVFESQHLGAETD
jgi:hypothetical protein